YHWSKYTREGIEKAIVHFREAIDLDPKYALAYSAIIDCYLRLATNYLPPEGDAAVAASTLSESVDGNVVDFDTSQGKVKLRREWDWRGAEREQRRAIELRTEFPAAHQWYAAYVFAKSLYQQSCAIHNAEGVGALINSTSFHSQERLPQQIPSVILTT